MGDRKIEKGTTFSGREEVDTYRALYYAGASGDFNPIHVDPEFGKMVGLGGAILQGLCTVGFVARTVIGLTGDPGSLKKYKCRFAAPVHILDVITINGEVTEVRDGRASITLTVANQDGIEVEKNVTAEIMV